MLHVDLEGNASGLVNLIEALIERLDSKRYKGERGREERGERERRDIPMSEKVA